MNGNYNNGFDVCGQCGAQFCGYECPQCGLVTSRSIIADPNYFNLKKAIVNNAVSLLYSFKIVPENDRMENAIVSFYYMSVSNSPDKEIGSAFKIINNNNEYPFNFVNSKLQVLKPERIKEFEQLYNDVIRIQKINDFEVYKNYYIFPLSAIRDYN